MGKDKKISIIDKYGKITSSSISEDKRKHEDFSYLMYVNIGFYLVIPLLVGVALGIFMDNWLKTKPILTIIFILLGTISSFYNLIRLIQDASHKH